jgi:hypothetical protein
MKATIPSSHDNRKTIEGCRIIQLETMLGECCLTAESIYKLTLDVMNEKRTADCGEFLWAITALAKQISLIADLGNGHLSDTEDLEDCLLPPVYLKQRDKIKNLQARDAE